ncbi:hypothetical protein ACFL6C_02290 [Myxococcota bacterium]
MASLDPRKRPHYRPTERLAILELRAARGWSVAQTARALLVQPATIASWCKRMDEEDESPLVQTPEPVNKYPAFVRHIVSRLKVLQPTMGKRRIAQVLARAGLHIGVTTVKRMLEWERAHAPTGVGQAPVETADQAPAVPEGRPNRWMVRWSRAHHTRLRLDCDFASHMRLESSEWLDFCSRLVTEDSNDSRANLRPSMQRQQGSQGPWVPSTPSRS